MSSERTGLGGPTTYPRGFSENTEWKWPLVPARELLTLNYGKALTAGNRRAGTVPVYGTNGQCGWHDTPLVEGPGVILGRKGQGPLGVEWCPKGFWVIDTAYYATMMRADVALKYVYHLIKYIGLNHLKDGTSNPTLSRNAFGAQLLPLPAIHEQNRIAEVLDAFDNRIALLRETNATLEAIAQALFKSWFVDFDPVRAKQQGLIPEGMDEATAAIFPDSFDDLEGQVIPRGWRGVFLKQLCDIASGKRPSERSDTKSLVTNVPLYGGAGAMGFTTESLFSSPKILTGRVGTLGKVHIAYPPFWASDNVLVLTPLQAGAFYFCFHWLKSIDVHALNRGSTQPLLTQRDLGNQAHVVPTDGVLEVFNDLVSPLYRRICLNTQAAQTLASLRDTLLPRLISGQLRLPEAEAIIEEVALA